MFGSERAGHRHKPATTLLWAFAFASLFWAIATPWWSFPVGDFASSRSQLLTLGVILVGTLLPFGCVVAALRHLPAPRAATTATLEPVLAAAFAYFLHDQELTTLQLAGAAAVLSAVVWVQGRRPDLEAESAPVRRRAR